MSPAAYRLLADLTLVVHAGIVAFVVLGLAAVWVGRVAGWAWVRNRWFRGAHLLTIGVVAGQALAGIMCPLTTWEAALRDRAGQAWTYGDAGFVAHWLHRFLFFSAEPWVFTAAYAGFALLVIGSLWAVPVRWRSGRSARRTSPAAGPIVPTAAGTPAPPA